MVLGIRSPTPPTSRNETSSAGINWKLFLLLAAGMIGVAFVIGMMMNEGDNSATKLADTNAHSVDIGQGSGPGSLPVAVETETPKREIPELTETENVGYINKYYPIDDFPEVLEFPDCITENRRSKSLKYLYITNFRMEKDTIKFCVRDRRKVGGDIHVKLRLYTSDEKGNLGLYVKTDPFGEILVPAGKEVCFARNIREAYKIYKIEYPPTQACLKFEA